MLTISSSLVATRSDANHSKWIIYSGSTAHMCSDRSLFQSFKNYKRSIQVGNSEFLEASGIGEVDIIARVQGRDTTITLKDVLFVPNILYNLVSASRCRKNGYKIVFENDKDGKTGLGRIVCEGSGETVMCAIETQDSLYEPVIKVAHTHKAHAASTTEEVWHRRLGRMSHEIKDKSIPLVEGLPLEAAKHSKNSPNCNDCLLGKSKKMPRPKVTEARKCSTAPLDRVFSDVVGPVRYPSMSNAVYSVTLLDDSSGFSMVRFLKRKAEAVKALKVMITNIETLFNTDVKNVTMLNRTKVKRLRTDRGGEYLTNDLKRWLEEKGITHELTTAYSPESNGRAERLNRTLLDISRSMMISLKCSDSQRLWAEALNCANYIRNRLFTNSGNAKVTPYEAINHKQTSRTYECLGVKPLCTVQKPSKVASSSLGLLKEF